MLTIVGTGIRLGQITVEAQHALREADVVLSLMINQPSVAMLRSYNPNVEDLGRFYAFGKDRRQTYDEIVGAIMEKVRTGANVCVAFYGHPCVFVNPSREAVRIARSEGFETNILPGISAEDCLFADLEMDPAENGCQSYEATFFVQQNPVVNIHAPLILWQIGVVGDSECLKHYTMPSFEVVVDRLAKAYGKTHETIVYQAPEYYFFRPSIQRFAISDLRREHFREISTLVIPPKEVSSSLNRPLVAATHEPLS